MTPRPAQTPLDRLRRAYQRDPRKVMAVAGLSVVMGVLWVRNIVTGPASASASVKAPVAAVQPRLGAASKSPADVALLQWLDEPAPVVSRNLFGIDPGAYPSPTGAGISGRNDNSDPAAKSDHPGADDQKQRETDALRNDAAKYRLQSTLSGPHPMAVVNGQMIGVGDEIGSFKVEQIRARTVTLAHGDLRIELNMD